MSKIQKLLDFIFMGWIFIVFFTLPTVILDLYEPEWVEETNSVKQVKLTYEFIDYEKQPHDFVKNYKSFTLKKSRDKNYASRGNRKAFVLIATGYCSCAKCCGKSDGITASGVKAHWGTVAGPAWMPFGTKLKIEGFDNTFTVEDRGGAIKGNRIDIWFSTHEQALRFGKRKVKVEILR